VKRAALSAAKAAKTATRKHAEKRGAKRVVTALAKKLKRFGHVPAEEPKKRPGRPKKVVEEDDEDEDSDDEDDEDEDSDDEDSEDEDDEAPAIPPQLEGMIAKPAAEATQAFVRQAIQAMGGGGQQGADPMAMMAQAELMKAEAAKMGAQARIKAAELAELDSQRDYEVAKGKLAADTGVKLESIRSGERKTAATIEAKNIN